MGDKKPLIWSFDPGVNLGFAVGRAGGTPLSRTVRLANKKPGQAFAALAEFFQQEAKLERPDVIVKEAPLTPAAMAQIGMSGDSINLTLGFHAILVLMAYRWNVPMHSETNQTIRKHFIGVGKVGDREATNRAVVSRCWQLGYVPRDVVDWDRCNALAGWDWASAHLARVPPAMLSLYAEGQK